MVLLIRQKQDDRAPHSPVTAVQGDCKNTSASKMLNVTMPIGSDVKHNRNSQCNSRNDSHVKLQYLSLETINVTKDVSTLSRNHDEKDEVVLFDASSIWSTVPAPQQALLSSLQVPVEQLPKRSSPLPSLHGDEVTEPNLSRIGSMVPDGSGYLGTAAKWQLWNVWDFCVLRCLRQCGPFRTEFKSKIDETN